uniref:Uncharacterized protein n=1 Tax=Anopheles maculatus TaxID=74869 RepID=A0A182SBE6_9DIPT
MRRLPIRRSITELLQQYNAPVTTTTTTTTATATATTVSSGGVTLGPTITAVTYALNALKPMAASTASVASGSTKVKVISAGQHQILHTTAKASPATATVKTGSGGGRTRTNGGVGVCLVPRESQTATVSQTGGGTITIRPFASTGFSGGTTTTISYLPSAAQSSASTSSVSAPLSGGTYSPSVTRTQVSQPLGGTTPTPASVRLSKPARTSGSTVTSGGSFASLSAGSSLEARDWPRLGGSGAGESKSFPKHSPPCSIELMELSTRERRNNSFVSGKPDALLSQSSVAMMPVTASPTSASSFCSSPSVWSPSLPSNLFGSSLPSVGGTGSPIGSGSSVPELSSLSGYDVNSFVNISHMLDPDGVIDLCDDLDLSAANLISLD